jgi:hypothetical protein
MNFLFGIIIVSLVAYKFIDWWLTNKSTKGYEDEYGFHYGTKPENR